MAFGLMDLVFPPRCVLCRAYVARREALCVSCRRRMVLHRAYFCGKCRGRRYSPHRALCHRNFPFLLAAAGEYEDPALQALIRSAKFHFVRPAAATLGVILADHAARLRLAGSQDLVVPIPLGRRRRRERGYNQAELIARSFAARSGLAVETNILRRRRETLPQSGLRDKRMRAANVSGCFEVVPAAGLAGRRVILVDDVVTTGNTMLAAALALRASGAKNILALVAAKA